MNLSFFISGKYRYISVCIDISRYWGVRMTPDDPDDPDDPNDLNDPVFLMTSTGRMIRVTRLTRMTPNTINTTEVSPFGILELKEKDLLYECWIGQ